MDLWFYSFLFDFSDNFVSNSMTECASCVYHPLASHVSVRLVSWNEKWPLIVMVNHILNMIEKITMNTLDMMKHQTRGEWYIPQWTSSHFIGLRA